jgi:hypothetical protein
MSKTTIIIERTTRELLKQLGRKSQTYDELINELVDLKQVPQSNLYSVSNKGFRIGREFE